MSISERATNTAIKFGLIFLMMIILTIFQELKGQNQDEEDSCCLPDKENMLINHEIVDDPQMKLFQKDI